MIELIFLFQAESDIQSAFNRYEEIQRGRGDVFLRQLELALSFIRRNPETPRIYQLPYRRMLIRDFPFGIFFQTQKDRIVVAAILDLRQSPESIRRNLGLTP